MKVALITGQLAKDMVKRFSEKSEIESGVIAMPVQVASLMNSKYIAEKLKKLPTSGFDIILVPGLVKGNLEILEEAAGVPIFKGPKHAADIPAILDAIGKIELSKEVPACKLLALELRNEALKAIKEANHRRELLNRPGNLDIEGLLVGSDYPMRVAGEIVDAPLLSDEEIKAKARYYVKSGADIVDVGMIAGGGRGDDAVRAVEVVKEAVSTPVSIDSLDPAEIMAAVDAGADMVLSACKSNLKNIASFVGDKAVVLIPEGGCALLGNPLNRVRVLERLIREAEKLGLKRILADPILDPPQSPGSLRSLVAYHIFRERNPSTPLFMGLGNVTELLDADTVGVNALLASLASEVGVSISLTTEVGDKTRGSVGELANASKMVFVAKLRRSPPKDLGISLLILKDEKFKEAPYPKDLETRTETAQAPPSKPAEMDPKGCFKIMVDRAEKLIAVIHYSTHKPGKPHLIIKGKCAEDIYAMLSEMNLITDLRHASYIGYELAKTELALKLDKSYVQDEELFPGV